MIHALLALVPLCLAPQQPTAKNFPDLGLTITLPAEFTDVKDVGVGGSNQLRQRWTAKLGSVDLDIELWVLDKEEFQFEEPEDVMDTLLFNLRDPKNGDPDFSFEDRRMLAGNFGVCPYVSLARGAVREKDGTKEVGTRFMLGGMLEKYGYTVEIIATPQPGLDGMKQIVHFLESGIGFKGAVRDFKWTDAEAKARWEHDAPDDLKKKLAQIVRTAHYIIFTDSGSKNTCEKFGEQMEKNYAEIKKVYPFDDVAGRRLMPLFLFVNDAGYFSFFAKQFNASEEEARKSKGVASGDWYATYFEAKNDPVHIHEGTHQIFRNRLRLPGGGSWFQEGVANYMSSAKNDRNVAANSVKKGKNTPLVDFVKIRSLLFSPKDDKKGGDEAASHYDLAALLIEFLHESKFGKAKFQDFIHAVGLATPNSPAAIERAVKSVYLTDLAGLEKQWVEYCKQRH
ncbi:MAG: hypothetical protein IPJ19_15920 [Planctomycetes bacterium]|nr:hypothetical protein [Planctomycetota bacterium]